MGYNNVQVKYVTASGKEIRKRTGRTILVSRAMPLRVFNKRSVIKRVGPRQSVYRVRTKTKRSGVTTRRVANVGRSTRVYSAAGAARNYKNKVRLAQAGGYEIRAGRTAVRTYISGSQVKVVSRPHGRAGGHGGNRHRRTYFARDSRGRFK